MAFTHETTIWCDGCSHWEQFCVRSAKSARALAQKDGWTRRGSKDLCKPCSTGLASDRIDQDIANRLGVNIS